jgi:hypothetical protein
MAVFPALAAIAGIVAGVFAIYKVRRRDWIAALLYAVGSFMGFYLMANTMPIARELTTSTPVSQATDGTEAPATPEPTDPPTAEPNHHDEREAIRAWWSPALLQMAMAQTCLDLAREAVAQGDLVTASGYLKLGSNSAQKATDLANASAPDGLSDAQDKLFQAASGFRDALGLIRDYMDNSEPSKGSDAVEKAQTARADLEEATHLARVHFRDLGGDPMALDDVDKDAAAVKNMLSALSGGSGSQ